MALVKFVTGTAAQYASLTPKDADTLYFITDERKIYKGDTAYSGGEYNAVTEFPATGQKTGVLYVNTATGEVRFWNGASWVTVVKPSPGAFDSTPTNDKLATQKAVADYVASKISDLDVGDLADRVETLEGQVSDLDDEKADKATTLAGYNIGDAYTKTETDGKITAAVANAHHLKREILTGTSLPDVSTANEDTIYMLPITDGSGNQKYEEFMLVNGAFEKIGDSAVDLTGYATEDYVDEAIEDSEATTKAAYEAADATNLAAAKKYADDLADNYATAEQGTKADSALQKADITEGATNGTIAVKGDDVKVHGLKSAAYAETTEFDAAGDADTALASAKTYTDQEITKALTWNNIV